MHRRSWLLPLALLLAVHATVARAQTTYTSSWSAGTTWTALTFSPSGTPAANDTVVLTGTSGLLSINTPVTVGNMDWNSDTATMSSSTTSNILSLNMGSGTAAVRIGRGSPLGASAGRGWQFNPNLALDSNAVISFLNIEKGTSRNFRVGGVIVDGSNGAKSLNINVGSFGGGGTGNHQFTIGASGGAANTFSGGLSLTFSSTSGATASVDLTLAKANALGSGRVSFGANVERLQVFSGTFNQTVAGLVSTSTPSISGTSTLTLELADSSTSSFAGRLTGAMSVAVGKASSGAGSGIQIFSGSHSYTNSTTISGGRLEIASAGSINSTSGVTVNGTTAEFKYNSATTLSQPLTLTQGILSGTGTIGTAVSVGSGATLSPGNSPGTQAFTSGLTWLSGGTYDWEINDAVSTRGGNPGWDLLDVTGGTLNLASLTSSAKFNLDLITLNSLVSGSMANYTPGQPYTWQIVRTTAGGVTTPTGTAVGGEDLTSLFNLVTTSWASGPVPSTIQVKVSSGGTGLDLVIVPEPETLVLAGIGAIMGGFSFWKRRRIAAICDRPVRS
jgi:autotransporter-associated beta strand protein